MDEVEADPSLAGTPVEIRSGRTVSLALTGGTKTTTIFLCHGAGGNKEQ